MFSCVQPNTHIALWLPSGMLKVVQTTPNTSISIGKFGSFPVNLLLGRPYYLTYEIVDKSDQVDHSELRIIPAAELHGQTFDENESTPAESRGGGTPGAGDDGAEYDIVGEDGNFIMRSNRLTVDDPSRQALTMDEIEQLKKVGTGSGKEIIAAIMRSHSALDEKTAFSLAKYTLRKSKKYLRRFTVLPMNVSRLAQWMLLERDPAKTMELREETLGLMSSWANVHYGGLDGVCSTGDTLNKVTGGRWLVVDETAGLVVAALAERMGILHPEENGAEDMEADDGNEHSSESMSGVEPNGVDGSPIELEAWAVPGHQSDFSGVPTPQQPLPVSQHKAAEHKCSPTTKHTFTHNGPSPTPPKDTITLLHPAAQPNLSLLSYFSYTPPSSSISRVTPHPLNTSLKTLSFLSLLHPHLDPAYAEPTVIPAATLSTLKSAKRGAYYRKRRRWERTKDVIDGTKGGGFDGLVVCSFMRPETVLRCTVGLVKGGGQVVVYSPTIEPLTELMDCYSSGRRTAFINRQRASEVKAVARADGVDGVDGKAQELDDGHSDYEDDPDFPVDPRLLVAPSLQTARAREWQVLPGRTHPLMTTRGGAEGYLFTATRVLPAESRIEAKGRFAKKRRVDATDATLSGNPSNGIGSRSDEGER